MKDKREKRKFISKEFDTEFDNFYSQTKTSDTIHSLMYEIVRESFTAGWKARVKEDTSNIVHLP
ncbi:MAG: hypothetical protein FWH04_03940 [Oscillospiraceae bacterium]|nr:hypothetical protein [Oscillospiraceae bacterium]